MLKLGQVSISPGAVMGAVGLFIVGLALTRAVRGWLEVRYLPKTSLDVGVRTSLAAAVSYLGVAEMCIRDSIGRAGHGIRPWLA